MVSSGLGLNAAKTKITQFSVNYSLRVKQRLCGFRLAFLRFEVFEDACYVCEQTKQASRCQ